MSEHIADQSAVVSTQATYSLLTAGGQSIYVEGNVQDVNSIVFENGGQVLQQEVLEENEAMQHGVVDDVDEMEIEDGIEEFMSVITTYQCKMCQFSSVDLGEFTAHVRSVHKKRKINVAQQEMEVAIQESETQVVQSNTYVFAEGTELIQQSSEEQVQLEQQPEQNVIQISENVSYEIDPTNATMPLLTSDAAPSTEEKELYVCATCSLAFSNIEACKDHMIQDHNVNVMDGFNVRTESQQNQVSVGTQANPAKKPGRKRNENRRPPSPAASVVVLSDEDGEELTDKYEVYETSNKRKVRPPKGLTQLYYISKQKTHSRNNRAYPLTCPISQCTASFKTQEALDLHLSCHIPQEKKEKKPWECPQCATQFNQWKQIRMHLWNDHQLDTDLIQCAQCEFRTDSQHRLEAHEELHNCDQLFKCDICGKIFKHRQMLKNHALVHSGKQKTLKDKKLADKSEKWFSGRQCPVCNRTLANERCLAKHIESVHSKDTLYHCPHCTYTATRKAMMQLHVRTHTGEKPFSCDQCDYKTSDHNTLRRHVMRHTGVRPYKCPHCTYTAIQAISLKNHIKNRHPGGQGMYSCDQCSFVSINELMYKNHLEDHKNGLVVPKVTAAQTEGQVIQVIKKGPLQEAEVFPAKLPASQMINMAISAMNQQTIQVQESTDANNMGQTITLHLPNNDQGEEMEVVNEINEQQVVMIQEEATPQEGTVAYTTDGQIVHTFGQLSEEMMQAISASCGNGQQVTINIAGETGELIITTEGGDVVVPDMTKTCDFQTVEQQTISIEAAPESVEQLPSENIVHLKENVS